MAEHPIQGLMRTALDSLHSMVDVNTVVGDPVDTGNGQVIIPVSRISLGFVAGGSEFGGGHQAEFPFGGGSGAGVSVQPVGFLVVEQGQVRMLTVEPGGAMERLMDLAPRVLERFTGGQENQRRSLGPEEQNGRQQHDRQRQRNPEHRRDRRRAGRNDDGGDGMTGEQDLADQEPLLRLGAQQPVRVRRGGGRDNGAGDNGAGGRNGGGGRQQGAARNEGAGRRKGGDPGRRSATLAVPTGGQQRAQRADRLVRRLTDAVVRGNGRGGDEDYDDELDGR